MISSLTPQISVSGAHVVEEGEHWCNSDTDRHRDGEEGLPKVILTEREERVMRPKGDQQVSKAADGLKESGA